MADVRTFTVRAMLWALTVGMILCTLMEPGRSGFYPREGQGRDFFSSPPRPDQLWSPPNLLSNGYRGALSLGVKRLGREAAHSPPSSSGVKNVWSCNSTPQYVFTAWCLMKPRDGACGIYMFQCNISWEWKETWWQACGMLCEES
jgi:hypothetical protein